MIGALVGGFVGGLVGGYIGGNSGSSYRSNGSNIRVIQPEIDHRKLACHLVQASSEHRKQQIREKILRLECFEKQKYSTCAYCGKEIECCAYRRGVLGSKGLQVELDFKCGCMKQTLQIFLETPSSSTSDEEENIRGFFLADMGYEDQLVHGINIHRDAFKDIWIKAYSLWYKVSDEDEHTGINTNQKELERLYAMLDDPLGSAEGLDIGTSASNGNTLMLAMDKECGVA